MAKELINPAVKLHVWGSISRRGKFSLYWHESSVNADVYMDCLFIPEVIRGMAGTSGDSSRIGLVRIMSINIFKHPSLDFHVYRFYHVDIQCMCSYGIVDSR